MLYTLRVLRVHQPAGKGECLEDGVDTAGECDHPLVGAWVGAGNADTSLKIFSPVFSQSMIILVN